MEIIRQTNLNARYDHCVIQRDACRHNAGWSVSPRRDARRSSRVPVSDGVILPRHAGVRITSPHNVNDRKTNLPPESDVGFPCSINPKLYR